MVWKDQVNDIYDPQGAEIARAIMVRNAFFVNNDSLCHNALKAEVTSSLWSLQQQSFDAFDDLFNFISAVKKGRSTDYLF